MNIEEIIVLLIAVAVVLYIFNLISKKQARSAFEVLHIDEIEFSRFMVDHDNLGAFQLVDRCYSDQERLLRRRFYLFASEQFTSEKMRDQNKKLLAESCYWSSARTRTFVFIREFPYIACRTRYGVIEFNYTWEYQQSFVFTSDKGLEFVDEFCELKTAYDALNRYRYYDADRKSSP